MAEFLPRIVLAAFAVWAQLVSSTRADDPTDPQCPPVDEKPGCVCTHSNGIIDLTPLDGKDQARFSTIAGPGGWFYDYNPCSLFTSSDDCTNVYGCQSHEDGSDARGIADQDEAIYINDDAQVYVHYNSPDNQRETLVFLVCNKSLKQDESNLLPLGEPDTHFEYEFQLNSCHACPGGCDSGGGDNGGSDEGKVGAGIIGILLIILILLGLVSYFVIGAVIMKFKLKKTGTDIIPNKKFWMALPLLIKDGCVFTVKPIIVLIKTRGKNYQEINSY